MTALLPSSDNVAYGVFPEPHTTASSSRDQTLPSYTNEANGSDKILLHNNCVPDIVEESGFEGDDDLGHDDAPCEMDKVCQQIDDRERFYHFNYVIHDTIYKSFVIHNQIHASSDRVDFELLLDQIRPIFATPLLPAATAICDGTCAALRR